MGATVEVTKVTTTTETATATMALLEQAAVYCCVVIDVAPRQKLAKLPSGLCSIRCAVKSIPPKVRNRRKRMAGMMDMVMVGSGLCCDVANLDLVVVVAEEDLYREEEYPSLS